SSERDLLAREDRTDRRSERACRLRHPGDRDRAVSKLVEDVGRELLGRAELLRHRGRIESKDDRAKVRVRLEAFPHVLTQVRHGRGLDRRVDPDDEKAAVDARVGLRMRWGDPVDVDRSEKRERALEKTSGAGCARAIDDHGNGFPVGKGTGHERDRRGARPEAAVRRTYRRTKRTTNGTFGLWPITTRPRRRGSIALARSSSPRVLESRARLDHISRSPQNGSAVGPSNSSQPSSRSLGASPARTRIA